MPRNSGGTYALPNPPVVSGETIESVDENSTRDDLATEITNSLDRQGRGGMLAPFRIADGLVASPGLAFLNDADNGLFRTSSDNWSVVCAAAAVMTFTPSTVTIPSGVAFATNSPTVISVNSTTPALRITPVSYTHLTLPTILLV